MALKTKNSSAGDSSQLNFIGGGTSVEGNLETNGSLRIDGRVKGMVRSGDTLTIGASGEVEGEIFAKNAIVGGTIRGNVSVKEKLILEATSKLIGNLKANKLIIDEGAAFNGKSQMGGNFGSPAGKKPEEQKRAVTSPEGGNSAAAAKP